MFVIEFMVAAGVHLGGLSIVAAQFWTWIRMKSSNILGYLFSKLNEKFQHFHLSTRGWFQ